MKNTDMDRPTNYDNLPEINSYKEIPEFGSEEEEAHFWGAHSLGPGLLEGMQSRPVSELLEERRKFLERRAAEDKRPA
jgi:hypothetical protein